MKESKRKQVLNKSDLQSIPDLVNVRKQNMMSTSKVFDLGFDWKES